MKTRKAQGKGPQGKIRAARGGNGAKRARPAINSSPSRPVAPAAAEEERDALDRRKRLEARAVDEAKRRREARNGQPMVGAVRTMQQVLREDCERWHLSARGAAKASGLAHPTANRLLKGTGEGYCDSLDRLIDGVGEDEVVLLERVIRRIKAARREQG